jgi:ornithine carbamoyltransferase
VSLRHFIDLKDTGGDAIAAILGDAMDRKNARVGWPKGQVDGDSPLVGHVLAMIFEKNSTRTRVSFDMAMRQLGGSALVLDGGSSQIGRGESIADTARVLSRYVDAIMIRTDDHAKVVEMAKYASVPVINGLTDLSHPCQILADMLTLLERTSKLAGSKWAWLGDGNNVCNSLIEAASLMRFDVTVACPEGFEPDPGVIADAAARGRVILIVRDAAAAVAKATVTIAPPRWRLTQSTKH